MLFLNAPTAVIAIWKVRGVCVSELDPTKMEYSYQSATGVSMMEVHALHCKDNDETQHMLNTSMEEYDLYFNISLRQPLLIFGQYEAILIPIPGFVNLPY